METVLVLYGGNSPERPISIRSADAVCEALTAAGYKVLRYDTAEPEKQMIELIAHCDVVFPVLHGIGGEDGTIQKLLEIQHAAYIGTGSVASSLCFDKWAYKQHLERAGFPQADGALVSEATFTNHPLTEHPFVLKPNDGGSSIDTYIVRDISTGILEQCKAAFSRHTTMLLEALIEGSEITVGVLDGQALPVIEIIPPSGKEFDLENKYNGATQELCPPKNISDLIQKEAQELAAQIHVSTGCRHMSRTDMIVSPTGNLFILETNTIPGMTEQSLFPKAAKQAGFDMPELMAKLIRAARS